MARTAEAGRGRARTPVRKAASGALRGRAVPAGPAPGTASSLSGLGEEELLERCAGQLSAIDTLLSDLRGNEVRLRDVLRGDAEDIAQARVAQRGAEDSAEEQARRLAEAERELRGLLRERDERERELAQLQAELQAAALHQQGIERGAGGDDGEFDTLLPLVQLLEEREQHARQLERRILDADSQRDTTSQALRNLLREHEELSKVQSTFYQSVEQEMLANQRVCDTLTQQLRQLQDERQQRADRRRAAHQEKARGEELYARLVLEKSDLEAELRRAKQQLRKAEDAHITTTEQRLGAHSDQMLKMEETMMLLKAFAIRLDTDYGFVGEVNERASEVSAETSGHRGLSAFADAFTFIRGVIEAQHGAQPPGDRWLVISPGSLPYESVEHTLSAVKQLVTCFDMLSDAAKEEIPFVRELVVNARHLADIAREALRKYGEIERARDDEQAEAERLKEERKRERLARKYAPKQRDPYSRAPASLPLGSAPPSLSSSPALPTAPPPPAAASRPRSPRRQPSPSAAPPAAALARGASPSASAQQRAPSASVAASTATWDDPSRPRLPLVSPIREDCRL
eukprot:TRINITY_DN60032_c0_g1_i1.p1 TRINITY_DN60032_c0_g1~~TRINITY_DN60032_c0_g1_i1.p1  ORF type:complete len:574 (+),score=162.39 TRINITY_DN60032_c0_g1_i1:66-1787(+)